MFYENNKLYGPFHNLLQDSLGIGGDDGVLAVVSSRIFVNL
jgi:hypothetical protein